MTMSRFTSPAVAGMLGMKQANTGVYPSGGDTSPQQAGGQGLYASVDSGGISANGRISAAMLAGVVLALLVFHKTTRGIQI